MRLTGTVLLYLALVCSAQGRAENVASRTDKRALNEGNASLDKRTIVNGPAAQSPAIEYAESTTVESDKSPAQQVYSTPVPPPAKFSDVVSGQHGSVPAAIAAQLHSQIPAYQTRFAVPTTYEVSAPVASQLAYAEHKMYFDGPPNSVQYAGTQGISVAPPKQLVRLAIRYPQQAYAGQPQQAYVGQPQHAYIGQPQQPIIYVPQPVAYQQGQSVQQLQHLQPGFQYSQAIPQVNYHQQQVEYTKSQVQPQTFLQQPQLGVEYAQKAEASNSPKYAVQTIPKDVRIAPAKVQEKQVQNPKPSGAISYVSFSQSPPPAQEPPAARQLHTKGEAQSAPNSIPQVQKPGVTPLILVRVPTSRYYPQPQALQSAPVPQVYNQQQQQYYQPQRVVLQNAPYHPQQPLAVAPTFPPVQYFGKFAPQIFGPGQH